MKNSNDNKRVLVMHHPYDWVEEKKDKKIKEIFNKYFYLVLFAHKHYNESNLIKNKNGVCLYNQIGTLINDSGENIKIEEASIAIIEMSLENRNVCTLTNYIFDKNQDIYKPTDKEEYELNKNKNFSLMPITEKYEKEFSTSLMLEDSTDVLDYFTFQPLIKYKLNSKKRVVIKNIKELVQLLYEDKRIEICGERYSGKTTLAKIIEKNLIEEKKIFPVFFSMNNINQSNKKQVLKDTIYKMYGKQESEYFQFANENKQRILIIDDITKNNENIYNEILNENNEKFQFVISFFNKEYIPNSSDYIEAKYELSGFFGESRNDLINNIINKKNITDNLKKEKIIKKIKKLFKNNAPYLFRDPQFLILFINYIIQNYGIEDVSFDFLFENIISDYICKILLKNGENKVIEKCIEVLPVIAHAMFSKNANYIEYTDLLVILKKHLESIYKEIKFNISDLIDELKKASIIICIENKVFFRSERFLSIFIAKYLVENNCYDEIKNLFNYPYGISNEIIEIILILVCNKNDNEIRIIQDIFKENVNKFQKSKKIYFNTTNLKRLNIPINKDYYEIKKKSEETNNKVDSFSDELTYFNDSTEIIKEKSIIIKKEYSSSFMIIMLILQARFLNLSRKFLDTNNKKSIVINIYESLRVVSNIFYSELVSDKKLKEKIKEINLQQILPIDIFEMLKTLIFFSFVDLVLLNAYKKDISFILLDYDFIDNEDKVIKFLIKILDDESEDVVKIFKELYNECNNEVKHMLYIKILSYFGETKNLTKEQYKDICNTLYNKRKDININAMTNKFLLDRYKNQMQEK